MSSIVIQHQIEASERAVEQIASGVGGQTSFPGEVESLLKSLVQIFGNVRESIEAKKTTASGHKWAIEMDEVYRRLEVNFRHAHDLLGRVETSARRRISGKDAFYQAWEELQRVVCFQLDRVMAADAQADRGEGKALSEITNELLG